MTNGPPPLVIVGAGGHAKVVIEAVQAVGAFTVLGCIAPGASATILNAPVLGGQLLLPQLKAEGVAAAVVALGSNRLRQEVGSRLQALGYILPIICHPSALISPSASIGAGSVIMARAIVGVATRVGTLAIVNSGAIIDHDNDIGNAAHVAPGCALAGTVRVGARTLVGVGSAVRPGVCIGDDVVIGAGSAVVSDVPDGALLGGVPARPIRPR